MTSPGLPVFEARTPRPAGQVTLDWAVLVVVVLGMSILLRTFVAQAFFIPTASMEPQLMIHDRILVSKISYRLHGIHRGDIVVFAEPASLAAPRPHAPSSPVSRAIRAAGEGVGVIQPSTSDYIKRVVGLPGETVEGKAGSVYVNGHLLVEPYLPTGTTTDDFARQAVPAGHLWVMGDNRSASADSRVFGPIPTSSVVGRTVLRIWPVSDASFL